ncbi:MAG: hypothetical protein LC633_04700, partial [Desulfobulbaceae bacterium]|nr:hypothetical protein [Desulfobulbaceae bacterium]
SRISAAYIGMIRSSKIKKQTYLSSTKKGLSREVPPKKAWKLKISLMVSVIPSIHSPLFSRQGIRQNNLNYLGNWYYVFNKK